MAEAIDTIMRQIATLLPGAGITPDRTVDPATVIPGLAEDYPY